MKLTVQLGDYYPIDGEKSFYCIFYETKFIHHTSLV